MSESRIRPLVWIGDSLDQLKTFPADVQDVFGYALYIAQTGGKHPDAKPLRGDPAFRAGAVLEVVDDHAGDTYRAVYTVRFHDLIYVLHCFQKKSRRGISTPRQDIELIRRRLKTAEADYATRQRGTS